MTAAARSAVHVALVEILVGLGRLAAAIAVLASAARGGTGEGAIHVVDVGAIIGLIALNREVAQGGCGQINVYRAALCQVMKMCKGDMIDSRS